MRKRLLITGSNGLLGQKLVHALVNNPRFEVLATSLGANRISRTDGYSYQSLDITNEEEVVKTFTEFAPQVIVNTAAMTNVDACESNQVLCRALNVEAVGTMLQWAKTNDAHLVHLSTDFVFDGAAGPYRETDVPNPLSFYGQSKFDAELLLQNSDYDNWAIARTIIVYGIAEQMSRSNIVLWAKGALEQGDPLTIVDDQFRAPTLAEDLAQGCILIAEQQAKGVFHLSGKDQMSILELVKRVAKYFDLDFSQVSPIKSATLNQAAKRPPITGFDLSKSTKELGYDPHSFEEGLAVLQQQLG